MKRYSKTTPETAIKRAIKSYLNLKGYFFFHNLAGLGCYPGIPDITAMKSGKVFFIEVKSPVGKQSLNQKDFQRHVEDERMYCVSDTGVHKCTIYYILATSTMDLERAGL